MKLGGWEGVEELGRAGGCGEDMGRAGEGVKWSGYIVWKQIKKEKESPSSKNKTLTLIELRATTLDPVVTFSTCILSVVVLPQKRLEGVRNERKQRNDAGRARKKTQGVVCWVCCSTVKVQSVKASAKERGYGKGERRAGMPERMGRALLKTTTRADSRRGCGGKCNECWYLNFWWQHSLKHNFHKILQNT